MKDNGETPSRRNTIDLQFMKENRSRKNTLELKVNGELVNTQNNDSSEQPPRTLSVVRSTSGNNSGSATPTNDRQRNGPAPDTTCLFLPARRQFNALKCFFISMCLIDVIHWAYLLRDDTPQNPNSWKFYKRFESFDLYYLVSRMFGDIFTCFLGLGAAMWTQKVMFTFPCTTIQLLFLVIRAIVWTARGYNTGLEQIEVKKEDLVFVACEFTLPSLWVILSLLIVNTTKHLQGYTNPPIIVLTVKNDNDESVQIEIA